MENKMPQKLFIAVCSLMMLFLGSCSDSKQEVLLRVGHVLDVNSTVHQSMEFMGKRLSELSGGTMRVIVYPSSQLGNERESLELLQVGSLDMTKVSAGVLENFVPAMGVYSLPYLFRDADHYWQVFKGDIGRDILLQGEPYFLRGLCYYDAGFRSFFLAEQKVEEPKDLDGLKIRVMRSNLQIRTINLLGGNATPLAYSELYSALQQGVVDGAENNPPNFYQKRFYELCEYFVLDEHSAPPDVFVMSTHTWNKLTSEQQAWIDQSVRESLDLQRRLWDDMTNEALKAVEEAGVKVIRPDKSAFQEIVSPIYEDLEGTELGKWADKIKALVPEETPQSDSMEVQN